MATKFGDSIQDYRVLNLLGGGGFGKVYRAIAKNGFEVAIKMINKGDVMASSKIARVKCEVEIHNRLLHPAILDVYNFFEDSNYIYLVLEICHNGSLDEFLKSRKLEESEARKIFHQVVDGLLYLHSHKILHRDLNLSNVLVTKDLKIKIADFGLATELKAEHKQFTMCGTPNYMAPEIASRSSHGLESDVWSLGCILYALLVGQPPFQTGTVRNTLHRVVKGSFQVPKEVSPAASDLISSMLKTDPRERLKLDKILHHPFMRDPVSTASRPSRPARLAQHSLQTSPESTRGTSVAKVCPLNAIRLRPVQHDTCNVHISVSARRTVVLKFRHRPGHSQHSIAMTTTTPHMTTDSMSSGGDHFKEIVEISTNGMEVKVFRPIKSSSSTRKASEEFDGFYSYAMYTYHDLPSRYWKKYNYASSYVDMVRSRTPKVITYSDEAKCMLMENGPNADFEALFYNGGKVRFCGSQIRCIEPGGLNYTLEETAKVPEAMRNSVDHAHKYLQVVRRIEASLDWDSEDMCFPIICKKRPKRFGRKSRPSSEAGQGSMHSSVPSCQDKSPPILRRVYVDSIGWAMQLSSGEVEVWCNDGSQLKLDPASNLSFLTFKDQQGNGFKYGKKDRDSSHVKLKLEIVTRAVQTLSSTL